MKNKQAFTLVELIVVVTILAILATIGFVSYSGYLTGVRDTNRVASLTAISDGLELYRTKNDLPLPDNSVEVQVESETIARQGYAGSNVLQTIEYSKAGKDPKDDQYYSYYLTDDKKHYQMMAFLEESDNLETKLNHPTQPHPQSLSFGVEGSSPRFFFSLTKGEMSEGQRGLLLGINSAFAATDYSNRHPKVYGKRLGILTDSDNTPIQEISTIKTAGNLNVLSTGMTGDYKAHMTDYENYTGTGKTIIAGVLSKKVGKRHTSCKDILDKNPSVLGADEYYDISPDGGKIKVYCDMTTDGGGWTPIFNVGEQSRFWTTGASNITPQFSGDNCDPWTGNCISSTYNYLPLGDDVMIDGSQENIVKNSNTTRVIVNDITSGKNKTVYDILNDENTQDECKYVLGNTDIAVKVDSLIVSGNDLHSLTTVNGTSWCMSDAQATSGGYTDKVFIFARSGGNAAGWPSSVYGIHAHKNYRLWTR